jgi:hypothetical protein
MTTKCEHDNRHRNSKHTNNHTHTQQTPTTSTANNPRKIWNRPRQTDLNPTPRISRPKLFSDLKITHVLPSLLFFSTRIGDYD